MAIAGGGGGAGRRGATDSGLYHRAGRATPSRAVAGSIAIKTATIRMKAFTRLPSGAIAALCRRG